MDEKVDLRIQKTYLALTNTFLQMLEEMSFEDIRVSELCSRAMIRKSTFYKHFGDKYELLTYIVRQNQKKLDAKLSLEFHGGSIREYYIRLTSLFLDFLSDNKALVQSAVQSNSFPLILSITSQQLILDIKGKLENDIRRGESLPASPEIMACFFVGGIVEAARFWMEKGGLPGDEELKLQLELILKQFSIGPAPEF